MMCRRFMQSVPLVCILIAGGTSILCPLQAQQADSASPIRTAPIPDVRFYPLIFKHVLYLQMHSDASVAGDQPALSVIRYYTGLVGATKREDSILLAEAEEWKSEVAPIDAKAYALITAIHARTPGGRLALGEEPPTPPQELIDLQSQKDAVTQRHIAHLRSMLGDTRFLEIDHNIRFVTHVTFHGSVPAQVHKRQSGMEER